MDNDEYLIQQQVKLSSQPGYDHIRVTIGNNLGTHLASSHLDNDGQGSLWPGGEDARSVSEMRDGKVPDQIKASVFFIGNNMAGRCFCHGTRGVMSSENYQRRRPTVHWTMMDRAACGSRQVKLSSRAGERRCQICLRDKRCNVVDAVQVLRCS